MEKILIHTCCADCLLNTIDFLKEKNFIEENSQIDILFYNPNIHPRSEYLERLNAVKSVIGNNMRLIVPDYKPKEHIEMVNRVEERCKGCWNMRLEYLFKYAKENKYGRVTSTLLVSHYQNNGYITRLGNDFSKEYGIEFIPVDSSHNSVHKGFYKQNYCGCCFSLVEKMSLRN